jgi:hypothetical protein
MAEHKRGTLLVVGSLVPGYRGVQASSGLDSYEIYQIHSKTHANYQLYQPTPTQRDGLGWGLVRKDEVSWGRSFSSRRAASSARRSELLHGVLDGGVGGRHGSLGPVCVSANARWAGRRGSETARGSRATALRTPLRSIARQARERERGNGRVRERRFVAGCRREPVPSLSTVLSPT